MGIFGWHYLQEKRKISQTKKITSLLELEIIQKAPYKVLIKSVVLLVLITTDSPGATH
jgi:hypothetical protein